jgi:glutamyl-tRNA reductase
VREKLVFDAPPKPVMRVGSFRAEFPDCEVVLLSTCNRVELYTVRPAEGPFADHAVWALRMGQWLSRQPQS